MINEDSMRIINTIVNRPYVTLLIILTVAFVLSAGITRLSFTSDYKIYFSDDNPQLMAFERIQNEYIKGDNILFVLAPKNGDVFTQKNLEAIHLLTEKAWKLPFSSRVDSITNFQFSHAQGEEIIVKSLVDDPRLLSKQDIQLVKQRALHEHELVNRLISSTGHVTGINVSVNLPPDNMEESAQLVNASRELAKEIMTQFKEVDIHLTGIVPFNNAFPEASQQDMSTIISLMYLVVFGVLIWFLRSIFSTLTILLTTILAIGVALGSIGWMGWQLNPATASAPTIILTLAVANGVHLFSTVLYLLSEGKERRDAIISTIRENILPITVTNITTAVGFLCLNFSDSPPFHDLGNTVAIGIAAIYIASLTIIPALMMILPLRVKRQKNRIEVMEKFGEFVIANKGKLLLLMSCLAVGLTIFIPNNRLDDQFVKYFDETIDFRRATDFTVDNLTGIYMIQYSLPAGEENGVTKPSYLKNVDMLSQWFEKQPEVIHVSAVTDVIKRINKNLYDNSQDYYRIPDSQKRSAENLLLYEMSLPYGLGLNNQININKSASRVTVILRNMSTQELLDIERRAKEWIIANVPEWKHVEGASPNLMFAHISSRNIKSMLTGNIVALILISILILIALRNVKIASLGIITNLLPVAMAFGLWGILYKEVGLSLSVVTSMTLGIIVDDTVYFLHGYLRARRKLGFSPEKAICHTYRHIGKALWITSFSLILGFGALTLSHFKLNSSMGQLTAITIAFALLVDLILLPAAILFIENKSLFSERTAALG